MALYSPVPLISALPALTQHHSPSYISPSPSPPAPYPRQVTRSERMLMAALSRADADKHTAASEEHDYFSRAMDNAWSRSQSVNTSPSRTSKRLSPPHTAMERSPSPLTVRGVERELARQHRGRTPSPSPHPYRPSSVAPNLSRTQTAPLRSHVHSSNRSSSPSQIPRRSTSPQHHRRESSSTASASLKRTAHEELLRSRLESVLAKQQQQDAMMADGTASTGTRSRGPSFSRTAPPTAVSAAGPQSTSTGDQWTWSQQATTVPAINLTSVSPSMQSPPKATTRRSPSISHGTAQRLASSSHVSGMVTPTKMRESIMITPPPSPPHRHQTQPASASSSRDSSQGRTQFGVGRPSRSPSKSGGSSRVTPPPFDARTASLALKQQHGYVSFSEVAGLGEPEGMDASDSEGEGDDSNEARGRGRWWEVWRK